MTNEKIVTGFTLVELLIVVVILAILAAVVIPQFSTASAEARESAVHNDVQAIRSAIALYRVQHNEVYPGVSGWSQFVTQLTSETDASGSSGTKYGPYIRAPFPSNKVSQVNTGKNVTTMPPAADGATGWIYRPSTGELRVNTTGAGPGGTDYFDL
jgi:general secretion pathway protein G